MVKTLCFLGFLREMELSKFFLLVVLFVYFDKHGLCLSIVFRLFIGFNYLVNSVYFLCSLCSINGSNIVIVKEFQLIFIYM